MSNSPWIQHVKNFKANNPSMSWRECLINAKSSYVRSKKGGMYNPYDPYNTKDPSQPWDGHDDTEYITQQYMQQPYNPYPKYTRHDIEPVFKKDDFGSLMYEMPKDEPSSLDRMKSGIDKFTKQIAKPVNKLVKQINQSKNKPNITMIPKPSSAFKKLGKLMKSKIGSGSSVGVQRVSLNDIAVRLTYLTTFIETNHISHIRNNNRLPQRQRLIANDIIQGMIQIDRYLQQASNQIDDEFLNQLVSSVERNVATYRERNYSTPDSSISD